jgi:hypothetical protein
VRLNREEIKSSPIVYSKIADSIRLAVGRDLSRHWRFTGVAAAIAEDESLSDHVARSGQKSAGNIAPQCNPIERIVVGKTA